MMCPQLKASDHVKKMISIKDYEHLATNQGEQTEESHMTVMWLQTETADEFWTV